MGDIKTQLKLERDTDNSYPGDVGVSLYGDLVQFELMGPERTIGVSLRRLKIVIAALEAERGEEGG